MILPHTKTSERISCIGQVPKGGAPSSGVPELLGRVGEEVALRALEKNLKKKGKQIRIGLNQSYHLSNAAEKFSD